MAWNAESAAPAPRPRHHSSGHPPVAPSVGRRALLLGAAGAALSAAGCSGSPTPRATSSPRPSGSGSPSGGSGASSAPTTALPRTTPWHPNRNDISGAVKLRAVRLVEAIGAWSAGRRGVSGAGERIAALGLPASLARQAGPLLPGVDEAALQVVEAQYGGILADTASVLVVCRQWTRSAGGPLVAGGTTVDVRLSRAEPLWSVTALHPASPGPAVSSLPREAHRVLSHPHIQLPPDAVADIRSGHIHDSVLRAMLNLAGGYRMYISVIRSGHPIDVFGTTRPSDHPLGRAFDVWQIDGRMVVDPATPRRPIEAFMRDAAAAGSYNVGGPVPLTGGASADQFFSDDTHHDHVHIGFAS